MTDPSPSTGAPRADPHPRAGEGAVEAAPADEPVAATADPLPPIGLRATPRLVWGLTVLYAVLLGASSVLTPLFIAPDEYVHLDLSVALADDAHYPDYDARRTSIAVRRAVSPYFPDDVRNPDLAAADAPPKPSRVDIDALGGSGNGPPEGSYNQQPQHPPLFYQAMGVALRVERLLVPGGSPPAITTELAFLRLVNAAMMLLVPWAAWAAATRLGADRTTAVAAAALAIVVPQMTHIGAVLNNDNLLVALGALLTVLLAGVVGGDRRPRTVLLVGLVTGAALLTKAFAFLFVPWIAVSFLVGAWRARARGGRPLPHVVAGAASGVVALAVSGWWWVGNRIRHGTFAPSLEDVLLPTREGFVPDRGAYVRRFGAFFVERFWGWFGNYSARLPLVVIVAATVLLAVLLVTGVARPGGRLRRLDVAVLLLPPAGILAFVAQHAWELHARTGASPFIQGRYLFAAMVPIALVAASGASTVARRWAAVASVGLVAMLHLVGFGTMLREFWGAPGEGPRAELRAVLAWSAWPGEAVVAGGAVGAVVALAALALVVHDAWPRAADN